MEVNLRMESKHKRKQNLVKILGGKCQLCGFDAFLEGLEFHHEKPDEKQFQISTAIKNGRNLKDCLEEVKKCYLLCANCHRGIHAGYYKNPTEHIFNEELASELLYVTTNFKGNLPSSSICPQCGERKSRGAKLCKKCAGELTRKCEHPLREDLKQLIRHQTFTDIGRQFQVNRESVRKWCKKENLPDTKQVINSYSDEEWELI